MEEIPLGSATFAQNRPKGQDGRARLHLHFGMIRQV